MLKHFLLFCIHKLLFQNTQCKVKLGIKSTGLSLGDKFHTNVSCSLPVHISVIKYVHFALATVGYCTSMLNPTDKKSQ